MMIFKNLFSLIRYWYLNSFKNKSAIVVLTSVGKTITINPNGQVCDEFCVMMNSSAWLGDGMGTLKWSPTATLTLDKGKS